MRMTMAGATALAAAVAASAILTPSLAQSPARPAPAATTAPQNSEGVAVIVNDEAISTFDVRQRATLMLLGRGAQPTPELLELLRAQALRELIEERLKIQEATARGIQIEDSEVESRIAAIASQNGADPEALRRQFASIGLGLGSLRQQVRAELAWRRLVGARFSRRVRISDREVEEEMERLKARITRPAVRVAEILLPAETPAEFAQAEAGAARLLGEINGLQDPRQRFGAFAQVARQVSAAPTAAIGGDRDWAAQGDLPRELQTTVDTMLPGQIAGPVRGPGGVYLLLLAQRRDGVDAATLQQVNLREVSAPSAQRGDLERLTSRINGCATLDGQVSSIAGAEVEDFGDVRESDLSEEVRARLNGVGVGRPSAIYTKGENAALMVVCARSLAAEGLPQREQIRDQLWERSIEILADRYLRDLRREAYIRG